MHILLKDLLKEEEEKSALQVQLYCDMDGVLVDMEAGFMELSGGLGAKEYAKKYSTPEKTVGVFSLINAKEKDGVTPKFPNFWTNLKPMSDAKQLWDVISKNFKDPAPIILTAGDRRKGKKQLNAVGMEDMDRLVAQKTQWVRNFTGNGGLEVRVANIGIEKPKEIKNISGRVTHVLLDDTKENFDAWNNINLHRIAILHTDAASSIQQLQPFVIE